MPSTTHPITKAMNPTEKPAKSIGDKQASISEIPEIHSKKATQRVKEDQWTIVK